MIVSMKNIRNEKGIGLIETLLALGVGIIVITSMVSLAVYTVRASLQSQLRLEGAQKASQEIELVRAFRDSTDWDTFIARMDSENCFTGSCYMDSTPISLSGEQTIGSGAKAITKYFTLQDLSGGDRTLIRVSVTVTWQIGSETKYAHNYTELSNWRDK